MSNRTMAAEAAGRPVGTFHTASRLIPILAIAVILPVIPYVVTINQYFLTIVMQATIYGIAVLGMAVILGYTGQINLAQAAFFGLGAYAVALGTTEFGMGFWTALLLGVAVAAAAGFVLGLTTLRLGGHYLAMITISFQQIFDLILVNWTDFTHGPDGVAGISRPSLFGYELTDDRGYLALCILALYATITAVWWLPRTRLGRAMQAVRENELAAGVIGVNTLAVKVTAFTLGAALAGLGGAFFSAGFAYISPENFSFKASVEFLTMALLGGAQSAFGAAIGTVLLILLPEWLRFLKEIYLAAYGLAVIVIMVFMPEGIWGIATHLWRRVFGAPQTPERSIAPLSLDFPKGQSGTILSMRGVKKYFGGIKAVDGVEIDVTRGSVHALIGPNGSGKTTTLNILSGIYRPTSGTITFNGIDVTRKEPHFRAACGLGRTFQNIRLFPSLSVLENVIIGAQRPNSPTEQTYAALEDRAMSALAFVGMADRADRIVKSLPYGHQRLVEIARALAGQPQLLLLDEPAAGLNQTEKQHLVTLLQRLRGHGLTIFLIEHDMGLIMQVSDKISVLNFGRKIAEGTPHEVVNNPDVIAAYLGESVSHAAA